MISIHYLCANQNFILFLFLNQFVNAIERNPAVVANNSSPAISVRKTCNNPTVAGGLNLVSIGAKYSFIMGCPVFELIFNLVGKFVSIRFA